MKYCFVTYQFKTGGVERVFCALAKEFVNDDVLLLPVTPFRDQMIKNIPENVSLVNLHEIKLLRAIESLRRKNPILSEFFSAIYLLFSVIYVRFSDKFKDTIFINFSDTISTLIMSYYGSHTKSVYSWLHFNPKTLYNSKFKSLYFYLYKKIQKIVCICDEQKTLLTEVIPGLDAKRLTVIYNILDYNEIIQLSKESLNFDSEYIVMVARFDKRSKDFPTLIAAYNSLPGELKNKYKLVFVGDGPDMDEVKALVLKTTDKDNIYFAGMQSNPYKWMRRSRLLVHSSKTEGLPMVLLEAFACDTPVVATNCQTGPTEILDNGQAGILVKVGDVQAMTDSIKLILEDDDIRKSLVEKGRNQLQKFSTIEIMRKINKLWQV